MSIEELDEVVDDLKTSSDELKKESYCRKCMRMRPTTYFYDAVDLQLIDASGYLSVCKDCVQDIYNTVFEQTQSIEKTIHKLCTSLNIKFSNTGVEATKKHINTLLESGKNVNAVFSIYKMKIFAEQKSMDKSLKQDLSYVDVGTVYTSEIKNVKEVPIPEDVRNFWGTDVSRADIEFLEREYTNFKQTHSTSSYAEIVLLKRVCYTMLDIKRINLAGDDDGKKVKELQELMKNLAISPNNLVSGSSEKGVDSLGAWIKDIEQNEPAQWLKNNPQYDMFRDVPDVEKYFQDYFVRPLKNAMGISKDFNVDDVSEVEGGISDDEGLSIFGGEE